jgi:NADPH-dependent 2,4-dienoyl-CoA reductase/sulfur reductase-like enzyme
VAATAVSLGCDVTVVESRSTPLEVPLGPLLGGEAQRRHESHGVRFALRHTVQAVTTVAGKPEVVLSNGDRLVADVVVEAVGSVGNVELLAGQGLDLSNGVLCDRLLHPLRGGLAVADVVVAGDVARFPIAGFGAGPMRVEHWTMPTDMAAHAASSLLAGLSGGQAPAEPFAPLPTFWSELYGVRLQTFGVPHLGLEDVRVLEGHLEDEAAVGYHRDGQLVGVVLIGMKRRMLEYRSAVVTAQRSRILEPAW